MESMKESDKLNELLQAMNTVIEQATDGFMEIVQSEPTQSALEVGGQLLDSFSTLSDVVGLFKAARKIWNIPTNLYLNKLEQYCRGVSEIPIEKREKYIKLVGSKKVNKDNTFVLNMVNRVEEEEKIAFFVALWAAKLDHVIDDPEYRRLMILVDRTLYSDLLYMRDHITENPVPLKTTSDFGLVSSGILISAGLGVGEFDEETFDAGTMLFNYSLPAKRLSKILFNIDCKERASNIGIMTVASNDETKQMLDEVFGKEK